MSTPGVVAGSFRNVEEAIEALKKQGFKKLNNSTYRVIREQKAYDAHIEVRDPYKKVVVHVRRSEGKHESKAK